MNNEETKQCSKCDVIKLHSQFMKRKDSKDGLRGWCRQCMKENCVQWREDNPEKAKEMDYKTSTKNAERRNITGKAWYKRNPDRSKHNHLMREYGISLDDYNKLLVIQQDKCAICGTHKSLHDKGLCVDHCHVTGKVRGLLCLKCNRGIGFLKDDSELCLKAHHYLKDIVLLGFDEDSIIDVAWVYE